MPGMDPTLHVQHEREFYQRYRQVVLSEAEPIQADGVRVVEMVLTIVFCLVAPRYEPTPYRLRQEALEIVSIC